MMVEVTKRPDRRLASIVSFPLIRLVNLLQSIRLFILIKYFICNEYSNIVRRWTVGQRGIVQAKCSWMYLARPLARMLD